MGTKDNYRNVLIIGGGPAGLMAAISARTTNSQLSVIVLEAGPTTARKLALTGGGRGNVTQQAPVGELVRSFGTDGKFLFPALNQFGPQKIREFFATAGVRTHEEENGRVFPDSQSAEDLVIALTTKAQDIGVEIRLNTRAQRIRFEKDDHASWYTECSTKEVFRSDCVIMAGGGASYPVTGSDGSCLKIARDAGIPIKPFSPALSGVRHVDQPEIIELSGVSVQAAVSYKDGGRNVKKDKGVLLFTKTGFSGPLIMKHSGIWGRTPEDPNTQIACVADTPVIQEGRPEVPIRLHFLPNLTTDYLVEKLETLRRETPHRLIEHLDELGLPLSLRRTAASLAQTEETPAASLTKKQLRAFSTILCDWPITVQVQAIGGATVCEGGIDLKALDPKTMMSRRYPGLFAAGELIDLTGPSGGYNLTACFASGYLAGMSSAQYSGRLPNSASSTQSSVRSNMDARFENNVK